MFRVINKVGNEYSVLDTSDGVVDTLDPARIIDIMTSYEYEIKGIEEKVNEFLFVDYNKKYKRVIRGSKFRIYPNKEQRIKFSKIFGCCRFVWNKMLAERINFYNTTGESLINHYNDFYKGNDFLKEVPARSLQMTERNLNTAYKNFFRRVSKGDKKVGFPKFKKKQGKQSYQIYNDRNCIQICDNKVRLPKVGLVKINQHRPIQGRVMTVTITKTPTDKYYISMNTEEWIELDTVPVSDIVGIDLGIKDLAILDNDDKLENPETLDRYLEQLRFYQQKLSRTTRGSNRYKKLQKKIARIHERVHNIRTDNIHKFTRKMIDENQVIITEDLNIKGMLSNRTHSKKKRTRDRHIANASWYEFMRQFSYKSDWYDRVYQKVGKNYPSTQLCHVCGYKNINLRGNTSIRSWICPSCGTEHDRDINAAKNIKQEGMRLLGIA